MSVRVKLYYARPDGRYDGWNVEVVPGEAQVTASGASVSNGVYWDIEVKASPLRYRIYDADGHHDPSQEGWQEVAVKDGMELVFPSGHVLDEAKYVVLKEGADAAPASSGGVPESLPTMPAPHPGPKPVLVDPTSVRTALDPSFESLGRRFDKATDGLLSRLDERASAIENLISERLRNVSDQVGQAQKTAASAAVLAERARDTSASTASSLGELTNYLSFRPSVPTPSTTPASTVRSLAGRARGTTTELLESLREASDAFLGRQQLNPLDVEREGSPKRPAWLTFVALRTVCDLLTAKIEEFRSTAASPPSSLAPVVFAAQVRGLGDTAKAVLDNVVDGSGGRGSDGPLRADLSAPTVVAAVEELASFSA